MHFSRLFFVPLLLGACATAATEPLSPAEPRIVRASDPATTDYVEGKALALTPPGREGFSQVRLVEHAGYRTPLHVHHDTDETFVVVSGTLTLFVGGKKQTLGPGDYAFIPRGTPHAQGNESGADTTIALTLVPGAFAGFFDARAELVSATPPGHPQYGANMRKLGERFDIEVLGPPPF